MTCIASVSETTPNYSQRCGQMSAAVLWMAFTLVSSMVSVSQVDRQLALLEEVIEPSELSARWGKARSKVGVVVALGSASKASAP